MTTLQLIQAVNNQATKTKKELTKSFFSGNKKFYNEMLQKYPKAHKEGDVYETINCISAIHARGLDY